MAFAANLNSKNYSSIFYLTNFKGWIRIMQIKIKKLLNFRFSDLYSGKVFTSFNLWDFYALL